MFQSVDDRSPVVVVFAVTNLVLKSEGKFANGRIPVTFDVKSMLPANMLFVTLPAPIAATPVTSPDPSNAALVQVISPVIPMVLVAANLVAVAAFPVVL